MTKLSDQLQLDVPLEDASWACREAVASMDWHLDSIEPHRLVLRRSVLLDPVTIEVLLSEAGPAATTVTLNGKLAWGFVPWDKRTLRGLMNSVRNAVEVAARRSAE